jgi:hypothetical protein
MADSLRDRIVVPFKGPRETIPVATSVKSTLLTASIEAVKKAGRFDEYAGRAPAPVREAIEFGVAGLWLPMEIAVGHYAAVDSLGFTEHDVVENGRSVGGRLNNTFLGVVIKLAGSAGTTPWLPIAQTGKLFERVFKGAGLQVERLGPKEARIDIVGLPLLASTYFRGALRGQILAGCEPFCKRAYVRDIDRPTGHTGSFRVSWV